MTLVWQEGFEADQSETDLSRKYDGWDPGTGVTIGSGRIIGSCMQGNTTGPKFRTPDLGQAATFIVGVAFNYHDAVAMDLIRFMDNTTEQLKVSVVPVDADNFLLAVLRGGTSLGSSSNISGGWNTVEVKALIRTSGGSVDVKVNGVSVLTIASANTANGGFNDADRIAFELKISAVPGSTAELDDIYVLNGLGSINNDFLGTCVIEGIAPDSEGASLEWVPTAGGAHYAEVDDANSDDDVSYVETPDNSKKDLYGFGALTFIDGSIVGVQLGVQARVSVAGARTFSHVFRDGSLGTEDEGTPASVTSTTYDHFPKIWEQNPETGANWTPSGINNGQFGVKSIA